ncbi:hypothetical protein [uncultured Bacteroides sp.]|uniref:hypothetical protein n=1 Tax=uncultured Bacteroides sp. TaxID=162156 RepID=UPI0025CD96C0|nr:hypothetical protein [uncultured Bacteroides sp.]
MKIDFRKIETQDIEGNKAYINISKELGNAIYNKTADIGELELAREIYKQGEIEVDAEKASIIDKYVNETFLAFVKESICPVLDDIINPKK